MNELCSGNSSFLDDCSRTDSYDSSLLRPLRHYLRSTLTVRAMKLCMHHTLRLNTLIKTGISHLFNLDFKF